LGQQEQAMSAFSTLQGLAWQALAMLASSTPPNLPMQPLCLHRQQIWKVRCDIR